MNNPQIIIQPFCLIINVKPASYLVFYQVTKLNQARLVTLDITLAITGREIFGIKLLISLDLGLRLITKMGLRHHHYHYHHHQKLLGHFQAY